MKTGIFLIKLPFLETVFHMLNRNLPQGTEVWPPGSRDINPLDYLKCGVSRRDINRSSHKKTVPDHHHHEGLQQHLQGGHQERVLMVLAKAGGGHWYQGRFYRIKAESIHNCTIWSSFICCYSYLSCFHHFYFHLKTGVNTPRTL